MKAERTSSVTSGALLDRANARFGALDGVDAGRLERWLEQVDARAEADADVVLTCGLFHRDPWALSEFERSVAPRVLAALSKLGADEASAAECLQATRVRLLVDEGGRRLTQYRGIGSFAAFVITAAVRALSVQHRGRRVQLEPEAALRSLSAATDLERQVARVGQTALFERAFRDALGSLSTREVALLKLNLVDGASIDELAGVYRVSRATAARWLASARSALKSSTLSRLSSLTRLERHDVKSLFDSVVSSLNLSLRRFVAEAAGASGVVE